MYRVPTFKKDKIMRKLLALGIVFAVSSCLVMPPQGANRPDPSSNTPSSPSTTPTTADHNSSDAHKTTTATAPASNSPVSVTIRSNCGNNTRVFFGQKPKYGSGRTSSVSSNSVSHESMKPGDMLWIVDSSDNGLTSATVTSSTQELTIGQDCKSIAVR